MRTVRALTEVTETSTGVDEMGSGDSDSIAEARLTHAKVPADTTPFKASRRLSGFFIDASHLSEGRRMVLPHFWLSQSNNSEGLPDPLCCTVVAQVYGVALIHDLAEWHERMERPASLGAELQ
jgi:hypothetical protein